MHPALHNTGTKISDLWASQGTTCAPVAPSGSQGMFILHMCVNFTTLSSGRLVEIGLDDGSTFVTGVPGNTKCPMTPASATAISTAFFSLSCVETGSSVWKDIQIIWKTCFLPGV